MTQPKNATRQSGLGPFIYSFLLHASILALCFYAFKVQELRPSGEALPSVVIATEEPVQAVVVDEQAVLSEIERIATLEQQKVAAREAETSAIEQKANDIKAQVLKEEARFKKLQQDMAQLKVQEERNLQEIKLAQKKERERLHQIDEQRQEEQDRLQQIKLNQKKEQKRLEALAEQKKKAEMQKAQDEKKKLEAQKQAKAQQKLLDEQKKQAAVQAGIEKARVDKEFERTIRLWDTQFKGHWIKPKVASGIVVRLKIDVLPDGTVHQVKVLQTSHHSAYDDSAVKAVWKSSPLPMPKDGAVIDRLRETNFGFRNVP